MLRVNVEVRTGVNSLREQRICTYKAKVLPRVGEVIWLALTEHKEIVMNCYEVRRVIHIVDVLVDGEKSCTQHVHYVLDTMRLSE